MRMKLRCTGGFAGPAGAQTRTIDLAQLPPVQAEQMHRMVEACDFFALPEKLVKDAPKSWDFQYDLEVDEGDKAHTIRYHLDAVPDPLRALTEKINDEVDPD
jgi:hypothetical protein